MRFKELTFIVVYLILLSSFASAQRYTSGDGNFVIEAVYAIVNGERDKLEENEEIIVRPGSLLQIKGTFKNEFTEEEDIDIDVALEGEIRDINDGRSLRTDDDVEVKPEESGTIILEFEIPFATYDNDFKVELEVDAESEDNDNYEFIFDHRIEIRKPEHELAINNLKLSKSSIVCDPSVTLSFDIINTGGANEKDVRYLIENSAIGVHIEKSDLNMDEGDITPITETINTYNMPNGEYYLYILAYCNDDKTSVRRTLTIKKEGCSTQSTGTQTFTQQQPPTQTQPGTYVTTQPTQPTQPVNYITPTSGGRVTTERSSFSGSSILTLLIGSTIGVGLLIYLIARLLVNR
ncbi:hypothetical protein KY360_00105 [Candidatus Woesearchaeota archaeon]|nr:hypothetical protein [Candidatus Woesearchaeota archaeon]